MAELADLLKEAGGATASFVPPPAVRAMAKSALDGATDLNPKAIEIGTRLGAGEPMRKADVRELGRIAKTAREKGNGLLFRVLGGAPVLKWAREVESGATEDSFDVRAKFVKVDDDLGIVFGWAIVSTANGEPYFDSQDDHIPESAMLKAAADFMANSRVLGDNHAKDEGGNVVFAFPLTADIASAFGIQTDTTGLMIGVKPLSMTTLQKFKDGTYTGFSIGGRRLIDQEVE